MVSLQWQECHIIKYVRILTNHYTDMNKLSLYTFVGCLALMGQSVTASAAVPNRAAIAAHRASNPRTSSVAAKATSQATLPITRVHSADGNQLYGIHSYTFYGDLEGWSGTVKIVQGPFDPEPLHRFDDVAFQGAYMDGKVLVVFHDPFHEDNDEDHDLPVSYKVFDGETWECEFTSDDHLASEEYILPYGLAYDHTTDKVYGSFYADGSMFTETVDANFGYLDLSDEKNPVRIVGKLPERMRALTFDKDGNLYGLSYGGDLYTINKFTGAAEQTGVNVLLPTIDWDEDGVGDADPSDSPMTFGRESMCCDWSTGDFYISYGDDMWDTYVARFSPVTGEAEIVADYSYDHGNDNNNVVTALSFCQSADNGETKPAAPADFTVTPLGTELKAEVSFTMPSADSKGNALEANATMTWTLTDGVNELATGTAHSGEKVTATVDSRAGSITFAVSVILDGATSKTTTSTVFIGCDTPVISGLPTVRVNGQRLTVTWNAAVAANSGNLDPVTYKVTRMPDNVVVDEACESARFTDNLESDIKTLYYYLIQPVSGSVEGETVESRSVYAGKYFALPLTENFDDEKRFLEYPVIDGNNDGNLWEYSTKYDGVAMYPGNSNAANDYLLIGPFALEQGMNYSFYMEADGHSVTEQIAVYVGTDADDEASFSTELVAPTILNPAQGRKTFEEEFTPAESGDYYFGIKACTPGVSQFIYVYTVEISGTTSGTIVVNPGTGIGEAGEYTLDVTSGNGVIRVSGGIGEEVAVYTTTGICVAKTVVEGSVEIPVVTGVYVVRAGDSAVKVAVR